MANEVDMGGCRSVSTSLPARDHGRDDDDDAGSDLRAMLPRLG
jgi:hypothetical protein